jgi:hypothetical protein
VVEGGGRALEPNLSLILEAIPTLMKNAEARRILLSSGGFRLVHELSKKARGITEEREQKDKDEAKTRKIKQ